MRDQKKAIQLVSELEEFLNGLSTEEMKNFESSSHVSKYKRMRRQLFDERHKYKTPFSKRTIFYGRLAMKFAAATQLEFYFLDTAESVHNFVNSVIIPFRVGFKTDWDIGHHSPEQNSHVLVFNGDLYINYDSNFKITHFQELLDKSIGLSQTGYLKIPNFMKHSLKSLMESQRKGHPLADLFEIRALAAGASGFKALSVAGKNWIDNVLLRQTAARSEDKLETYAREISTGTYHAADQPYHWISRDEDFPLVYRSIKENRLSLAGGVSVDIYELNTLAIQPSPNKDEQSMFAEESGKILDQIHIEPNIDIVERN